MVAALSRIGLGPFAITRPPNSDGAGAQVHAVMSVQAFCNRFGIPYLHSPFDKMCHASGDAQVKEWERSFNLGLDYPLALDYGKMPVASLSSFVRSPHLWKRSAILSLPSAHGYTDTHTDIYDCVIDRVRSNFLRNPRASAEFRIAVHVRRGDVGPNRHAERYTENRIVAQRIERIRSLCSKYGVTPLIQIHSEGLVNDFDTLDMYELHLNENPLETLRSLALADLLVMAKSSFSYVAGLLNTGIVVYETFWHSKRENWLEIDDYINLERRIAQHAHRLNQEQ